MAGSPGVEKQRRALTKWWRTWRLPLAGVVLALVRTFGSVPLGTMLAALIVPLAIASIVFGNLAALVTIPAVLAVVLS